MKIRHYELKARHLRDGHLLRIGSSTNYVLVSDAKPDTDGRIGIWIYDGDDQRAPGVRMHLQPDELVCVSTAASMPVRLTADDWEDILDALGEAAHRTDDGIDGIDCVDCRLDTSGRGCDEHAADWAQVDRWRELAPRLREQVGHQWPATARPHTRTKT